jgi:hypothetical protein
MIGHSHEHLLHTPLIDGHEQAHPSGHTVSHIQDTGIGTGGLHTVK